MDSDRHMSRHRPQLFDSPGHASFLGDASDASPFQDTTRDLEASWMVPSLYASGDATIDSDMDVFSPRDPMVQQTYRNTNALGLDISVESPEFGSSAYSYPLYSDEYSTFNYSSHSRHPLPSIITSDLPSPSPSFSRTPGSHSPLDRSMSSSIAPYQPHSASASTPSTAGHNSMPMTPAPLPPASHPHLMIPQSGGMYSPGSSYISQGMHHTPPSPSKSPYSPMTMVPSPSVSPVAPHQLMAAAPGQHPNQRIYTVLELASRFPDAHLIVPQKTYRPNTQSDRRRYVEEIVLEQPIMFYAQHPEGCGINCKDAMNSKFSRLIDRDDSMFINRGPSVSIRINWPGYPQWSRQIPTRDFRSPPGPITRSKLAKNVAKTIQRFLDEKKDKAMEEDVDLKYKVADIHIEQIELVGLQHVSMGSWQAWFRLRPRT